jgi:penicillin amidase
MADLSDRYGQDWRRWRWGEAHPALLAHRPFDQVPMLRDWFSRLVAVGGDATTVNVASPGAARPELPFAAVHAAGYRAIYDLAQPDRSRWIVSTGQSGHPLSPYYVDQASRWAEGRYLTMSMNRRDFSSDAVGTLSLRPTEAP